MASVTAVPSGTFPAHEDPEARSRQMEEMRRTLASYDNANAGSNGTPEHLGQTSNQLTLPQDQQSSTTPQMNPETESLGELGTEMDGLQITSEERAEEQARLAVGGQNAAQSLAEYTDVNPEIVKLYAARYPAFRALWLNANHETHKLSLRALSSEIRAKSEDPRYHVKYDHVPTLIAQIETMRRDISTYDPQQYNGAVAVNITQFLKDTGALGLDWKKMVTTQCGSVARKIFQQLPAEDEISKMLALAFNRANDDQRASVLQIGALVSTLQSEGTAIRRSEIYKEIKAARDKNRLDNATNGYHPSDHELPIELLKDAEWGLPVEQENFNLIRSIGKSLLDYEGARAERDALDPGISSQLIRYLTDAYRGPIDPTSLSHQPTGLLGVPRISPGASNIEPGPAPTGIPPQLNMPQQLAPIISEPHVEPRTSGPPGVALGVSLEWQLPGVTAAPAEPNVTDLGIVETVRKAGGKNGGHRVIINVGTMNRALYEVFPGADLGRGAAQSLYTDTVPVVVKDRLLSHVQTVLHVVEVEKQYIKVTRPGEVPTRPREPITYFKIQWSQVGRTGDFSGTPETQWTTRSDLISFCGKRKVELWRAELLSKRDRNKLVLDGYKRKGLHPETKTKLTDDEKRRQPWLVMHERVRR